MPIPKPQQGETQDEFIDRCMSDDTMVDEYPQDQRFQICTTAWESERKARNRKRQLEVLQAEVEL